MGVRGSDLLDCRKSAYGLELALCIVVPLYPQLLCIHGPKSVDSANGGSYSAVVVAIKKNVHISGLGLVAYSPWGHERVGHNLATTHTQFNPCC